MTRSYLLQVAESIKLTTTPKQFDVLAPSLGSTYETKFLGKPILLYVNSRGEPLAIYYKKVMYCFASTTKERIYIMKEFYNILQCNTKVFLYANGRSVAYRDEEGVVHYDKTDNPMYGDYCSVIPIPIPRNA